MTAEGRRPPGWTCANCGSWVGQNMPHFCTKTMVPTPHPSLPDQTERLISAIERLIAALEKANLGSR